MQIFTWTNEDHPSHLRVIGRIFTKGTFLPTVITGSSIEVVEGRAQEFWDKELERRRPKGKKKKEDAFTSMFG